MKQNKHYFLRLAIIKTMLSGFLYLLMPLIAHFYHLLIGKAFDHYWGYVVLGGAIMIIGNMILLARAWTLAFDSDARERYFREN